MTSRPLVFVGHSHITAMIHAARDTASITKKHASVFDPHFIYIDAANVWASPLVVDEEKNLISQAVGYELNRSRFFESDKNPVLVSIMGGNIHNAVGLLQYKQPFDVILPDREELPLIKGAEIVPVEVLLSFLRSRYDAFFSFMRIARNMGKLKDIYWVESPPPIPSEKHIEENLGAWFTSRYPKDQRQIAPKLLRYKLWSIVRMMLDEQSAKDKWKVISVPRNTLDDEGYLVPEAWWKDSTHGSPWYGEQVLKAVYSELGVS